MPADPLIRVQAHCRLWLVAVRRAPFFERGALCTGDVTLPLYRDHCISRGFVPAGCFPECGRSSDNTSHLKPRHCMHPAAAWRPTNVGRPICARAQMLASRPIRDLLATVIPVSYHSRLHLLTVSYHSRVDRPLCARHQSGICPARVFVSQSRSRCSLNRSHTRVRVRERHKPYGDAGRRWCMQYGACWTLARGPQQPALVPLLDLVRCCVWCVCSVCLHKFITHSHDRNTILMHYLIPAVIQ